MKFLIEKASSFQIFAIRFGFQRNHVLLLIKQENWSKLTEHVRKQSDGKLQFKLEFLK
jgi:hypothetical protein